MQIRKWSLLALAIAAATSQMTYAAANDDSKDIGVEQLAQGMEDSSQGQSKGFIEDSDLTLLNRNVAFYKNFRNNNNAADNGGVNSNKTTVTSEAKQQCSPSLRGIPKAR